MEKKSSVGVTIISGLLILYGLLIGKVFMSMFSSFPNHIEVIIALASAGLFLITGIGILYLKKWARIMGIWLSGIVGVCCICVASLNVGPMLQYALTHGYGWRGFFELIVGGETGYLEVCIFALFFLPFFLIFIFLTRPKVKEQFK